MFRRSFLSLLSASPLLGWLKPKVVEAAAPERTDEETIAWLRDEHDRFIKDFQEHNFRWMEEYLWGSAPEPPDA